MYGLVNHSGRYTTSHRIADHHNKSDYEPVQNLTRTNTELNVYYIRLRHIIKTPIAFCLPHLALIVNYRARCRCRRDGTVGWAL